MRILDPDPDQGTLATDKDVDRHQISFISLSGCLQNCAEDHIDEGILLVTQCWQKADTMSYFFDSFDKFLNEMY